VAHPEQTQRNKRSQTRSSGSTKIIYTQNSELFTKHPKVALYTALIPSGKQSPIFAAILVTVQNWGPIYMKKTPSNGRTEGKRKASHIPHPTSHILLSYSTAAACLAYHWQRSGLFLLVWMWTVAVGEVKVKMRSRCRCRWS